MTIKKIKVGDVVLFNWKSSIFSKLITKFNEVTYGESKCTHAGIVTRMDKNYIYISEPVTYAGVKEYPYERYWIESAAKQNLIIIKRAKKKLSKVYLNAQKYFNIKYGVLDILAIGLYRAFKIRLSLTHAKRLICSEFVVRVLYDASNKQIDFEKEFKKPFDLIDPMNIYNSKQLVGIK